MKLMPYKRFSKSSKALRHTLGIRVVHPDKSPRGRELVVNWGCSKDKPSAICRFLNVPSKVAVAIDKLATFKALKAADVAVPEFTTDVEVAKGWIRDEYRVLARYMLRSHSGNGIKVVKTLEEMPSDAPLYVRYYRKKHEFRVHVFNGQVIDYVQKKAKSDKPENFNEYVRSYNNGWVFCRDNIVHIDAIKQEAVKAVVALGLDFGAVDIIYTKNNKPIVLEVNCAPALEGTTVEAYARAFSNLMR